MQTLYHVNVGFKVFFTCKPPNFLLLMLNHNSYIFPRRLVSFWFFSCYFAIWFWKLIKPHLLTHMLTCSTIFQKTSLPMFPTCRISVELEQCSVSGPITLSNPALSPPSGPQWSAIRTVPGWQLKGPRASKGQLIPAATLEREICSPQKMSC